MGQERKVLLDLALQWCGWGAGSKEVRARCSMCSRCICDGCGSWVVLSRVFARGWGLHRVPYCLPVVYEQVLHTALMYRRTAQAYSIAI